MSISPSRSLVGGSTQPQGYLIKRSLRFRSSASAYLSRTPTVNGDSTKFTLSCWVKRGTLNTITGLMSCVVDANNFFSFGLSSDQLGVFMQTGGVWRAIVWTNAVFRDPSAWYHIVMSLDTNGSTGSGTYLKVYINGVLQTLTNNVTPNGTPFTGMNNTGYQMRINYGYNLTYSDQYIAEYNWIDGQIVAASAFGQTDAVTGVWTPKKYTGTYGTNGFYLPFSDNTSATTLAYDKSGNANNWTPNNISTTAGATYDSMTDVPTLTSATAANFATLNPINKGSGGITLSEGNLGFTSTATTGACRVLSTIGMSSGKWYCEFVSNTTSTLPVVGIASATESADAGYIGSTSGSYGYYASNGNKYNNGVNTAYGATYNINDVIGIAFDADAGTLAFYKNGVSQGTAFTGIPAGTYYFGQGDYSATFSGIFNFGQRPFSYTPPTGFKALNTFNLPDPTIKKPNQYMDATAWTGDGTSSRAITNSGSFQPDLVWTKARSGGSNLSHNLVDSVRGSGLSLFSDQTTAETSLATGVTSFNSNGFQIGTWPNVNGSAEVGWQWKKGATPGFDIVTYTGNGANRTIAHNLGVAPKMIIVKSRSIVSPNYGWQVQHTSLGATKSVVLNSTSAALTSTGFWNDTAPTSSVFTVGNDWDVNKSAATYVAYLFAEIPGFSKFGSYTGNGSADGPFVYCGFRPKYVMAKGINGTTTYKNWTIHDTTRSPYNVALEFLHGNSSEAEGTATGLSVDILSNGFKVRGTDPGSNTSGDTYIFAAFAENPFKYSLAR